MSRPRRTVKPTRRTLLLAGAGILIGVIAVAAWNQRSSESTPGDPADAAQVTLGAEVYGRSCAKCHGRDLKGEFGDLSEELGVLGQQLDQLSEEFGKSPLGASSTILPTKLQELSADSQVAPAHNATGKTWRHADQQLFEITKFGGERLSPEGKVSRMPAFASKLDDAEIWAAIAFIKSFWPEDVQEAQRNATTNQEAN